MNCPNCNALLEPGQNQCNVCGAVFGAPTAPQTVPEAVQTSPAMPMAPAVPNAPAAPAVHTPPVAPTAPAVPVAPNAPYSYAPMQPAYQPSAKDRGLSKAKFLKTEASKNTKTKALVAWILFAALAIYIVVTMVMTFTTPVYKLPIIELVIGEEAAELEEELDEMSDKLEYLAEEFEEISNELEDEEELDDADIEAAQNFFDKAIALTDDASAQAVINAVNAYEELYNELPEEFVEEIGLDELDFDSFSEIKDIMDIVIYVVVGFGVFLILLGLLGAAFKLTAMPVLVLLFYWILTLALTGLVSTIIFFVITIAFAVMCSGVNKEFKAAKPFAQPAPAPYSYQ